MHPPGLKNKKILKQRENAKLEKVTLENFKFSRRVIEKAKDRKIMKSDDQLGSGNSVRDKIKNLNRLSSVSGHLEEVYEEQGPPVISKHLKFGNKSNRLDILLSISPEPDGPRPMRTEEGD